MGIMYLENSRSTLQDRESSMKKLRSECHRAGNVSLLQGFTPNHNRQNETVTLNFCYLCAAIRKRKKKRKRDIIAKRDAAEQIIIMRFVHAFPAIKKNIIW